jgi:WD40 repeat protein/serine/threonine protein kinase
LLEEIARGGMGVVYRAFQLSLRRFVALKMVLSGQFAGESELKRFHREAQAAAGLDHPNIVPIYEVGLEDGRQFFSMKLVAGGTLTERLEQRGAFPATDAARLTGKVARAIHYAHQRGVLHRDLKPGNILLDADEEPHVSDFGLVKHLDGKSVTTAIGAVLGSPSYMAPEQALGKTRHITTSADVYSLGAILYELLTGQPPFRAETPLATLKQVVEHEAGPPSALNPRVDPDLDTICLKCLAKEPAHRYSSAETLAEDLERWLAHTSIRARRASQAERLRQWIRRNPALALLVSICSLAFTLGLSALAILSLRLISANHRVQTNAEESRRHLVELHLGAGERLINARDPLRALLHFTEAMRLDEADPSGQDIHRLRLGVTLEHAPKVAAMLFHNDGVWAMEFDADGKRLVTGSADRTARVWDLVSGAPLTSPLVHQASVEAVRFSPNGRLVASLSRDGCARVWDAATGVPLTPWLKQADFRPVSDRLKPALHFSPDGSMLLTAHGSCGAWLWDSGTGRLLRELVHADVVNDATFSPDGRLILTACADRRARLWNAQTGEPDGPSLLHTNAVDWVGFFQHGERLFTVTERRVVHLWNTATRQRHAPPIRPGHVLFHLAFSPDGQQLGTGGWHGPVWLWDTSDGNALRAMPHEGGVMQLCWSPDGARLATACWDGTARIWSAATGQVDDALLPHASPVLHVGFSPDGSRLATGTASGLAQVWKLTGDNSSPVRLPHQIVESGEFSPDGRYIVTVGRQKEEPVRVWDTTTGSLLGTLLHSAKVESACFSPDSTSVLTAARDGKARLWCWREGREAAAPLAHTNIVDSASFSPDGLRIVTACRDGAARLWDCATGHLLVTLGHTGPVLRAVFSPDGALIGSASADRTAALWDSRTGELLVALEHQGGVHQLAFNADGTRLLTACHAENWAGDGSSYAQVWEVPTGRPLGQRLKHRSTVNDLAFSRDSEHVVTASSDQTVQLWDPQTGCAVASPLPRNNEAMQARFSPDGRRLATGNNNGEVRLWDAATGQAISPPLPHPLAHDVMQLRFSPDGEKLLVMSGTDTAWLHSFHQTTLALQELQVTGQVLAGHRLDAHGGLAPLERPAASNGWVRLTGLRSVAVSP